MKWWRNWNYKWCLRFFKMWGDLFCFDEEDLKIAEIVYRHSPYAWWWNLVPISGWLAFLFYFEMAKLDKRRYELEERKKKL